MTSYNVHLTREMRVTFGGIEAESPESAASIAALMPTGDADDIADCDGEDFTALVDVAGDEDFGRSVTIEFASERHRKAAPALLASLEAILPYAEGEAYSLDKLKDSQEAEAEARQAWQAIADAQAAIKAANDAAIVPAPGTDFEIARQRKAAAQLLAALQLACNYLADGLDESDATEIHVFTAIREAIDAANDAATASPTEIDIHAVLAESRQIADVWGIQDVQSVRPDLSDEQAWAVLQSARRHYDGATGINWDVLASHAEEIAGAPLGDEA